MLSGISITCFASSYAIALALEATRLLFRSGIRGAMMVGFAGAGLFAHTVFLYHRAVSTAGAPLASQRDWYLLAAWGLAAVYFYSICYHPKMAFGLFLLPLALGLLALGAFVADPKPYAREPASQFWGIVHGTSILLATVTVLVGSAAGLMYLHQASRLKRKLPPRNVRLPSLEWLERINSRAIVISAGMLGIGVASGMLLNRNRGGDVVPWRDPVVLTTLLMFAWLGGTAAVGRVYSPARRGQKVAYLTVFSCVFLLLALAAVSLLASQHGGARAGDQGKPVLPRTTGCPPLLRVRRVAAAQQPLGDAGLPAGCGRVAA